MTTSDLFLQERKTVSVLPATFIEKAYSYALPEKYDQISVGTFVEIPLNNRKAYGVVWPEQKETQEKSLKNAKLKEIKTVFDLPPLSKTHIEFIQRLSDYTLSPLGAVLKMSLSVPKAFEPEKGVTGYQILTTDHDTEQAHETLLKILRKYGPQTAAHLKDKAKYTPAKLKTLVKNDILEKTQIYPPAPCKNPDPTLASFGLSEEQSQAAQALITNIRNKSYSCALLDGVTGSGKTEVYFEAVAEALKQEKQVVIMLPEIALSNAFLDRFKRRFGCTPALWHSALTPAQRRKTWRGVATGETKVIVGARSSLLLPYTDLGLIIVDEEHDPAYKQEDQVIYNARDMAVLRAHIENIPICLASATPSLETMHNVWEGRYQHLQIPERFGGALLPDIHIVDMREHKPEDSQHFISNPLKEALTDTLEKQEQGLLFLNRRGYAPLTLCRACGHRFECPSCSAWLTMHKNRKQLLCHHCGHHINVMNTCPSCGETDSLTACGPGVERIAEEIKEYFPDKRLEILASDVTEDNESLRAALDRIKNNEVDLIIGTQIVAKGHHFPKLTCVGVIDADLGLDGGDLRATEKTYHLLHQVAGRAGREATESDHAGQVFIQTWMPENAVIQALAQGARDDFLEAEAEARKAAFMPPYSRLVSLIISGSNEKQALQSARDIAIAAPQNEHIEVLGPAPAPLSKLRDKYRFRLLVIADKKLHIQKTVKYWISNIKVPSTVRVQVDIDPQSFL